MNTFSLSIFLFKPAVGSCYSKSGGVKSETIQIYSNVSPFNLPVCGDDMLDDGLI